MFYTETISFQPKKSFLNSLMKVLRAFRRSVWRAFESAGRARAAAELSRQGYHEEAKALMTRKFG